MQEGEMVSMQGKDQDQIQYTALLNQLAAMSTSLEHTQWSLEQRTFKALTEAR